jgi:flagellar FliJ protein
MGFKFKYETLLNYREHLKEKAEIALAAAQRQLRKNRDLLEEYSNAVIEANERLESGLRNRISSNYIRNYSSYVAALKMRMEFQTIEIANSEKTVAEKMKILLEKTRQCNIFEKLKEREQEKWRQSQNITERKEMNETALLRHGKEFL